MVHLSRELNQVAVITQTNINREFVLALEAQLHANHVETVDNPSQAHYWLVLEQDHLEQTLTNVAASTAPRQYQLTYGVLFSLTKASGKIIIPSREILVTQQATINNDRILGSNFEAHLIEKDLKQKAAQQVLYQLSIHDIESEHP